jgi:hypothetical protein
MSDDLRLRALAAANAETGNPEPEAALDIPEQADGPSRSDVEALKDGSAMLLEAGNRIAALALLWSAVAIDPIDLGAHRRLAAMLANAGDVDGAANEYARYIDFVLPLGDVARAANELQYGAHMLGGHPSLHDAAEKIAAAVRGLVPGVAAPATLPAPRLLPKVPFRFCIHDDGELHWMQLEGGTDELTPSAVRLVDHEDNVIETRKCIPLAPGQKGHARLPEGEVPGVAWVVLGVSDDFVAALDSGRPMPYRFEAKVGDEWLVATAVDTACRLGRRSPKVAVS